MVIFVAKPLRIGVYGGTFDPFHKGHFDMACAAQQQLQFDRLLLVPVFAPAHKSQLMFSFAERLAMLELIAQEHDWLEVCAIEATLTKPSYTYKTLLALQATEPSTTQFTLVLGEDAYLTLPSWYQWPKLQSLCTIAVLPRDTNNLSTNTNTNTNTATQEIPATWITAEKRRFASSEIQQHLHKGSAIDSMVPHKIANWIARNKPSGSHF